jgi:hypothetical protein
VEWGRYTIVEVLALAVGVVTDDTGAIAIRVDWVEGRWGTGPARTTRTESSSLLSLDSKLLDGPDQVEQSLVIMSVEARIKSGVGDFDFSARELEAYPMS